MNEIKKETGLSVGILWLENTKDPGYEERTNYALVVSTTQCSRQL